MTKARILADYVAGGTTAAEFDYMDGVTSNVQTQLDAKLPLAGGTMTGDLVPATPLSNRNVIINGNFDIWQRGTTFTNLSTNTFSADRWRYVDNSDAVHTISRDTDVPTQAQSGYKSNYSLKVLVTTDIASTGDLSSDHYSFITQKIEGYNVQPLQGNTVTLSFWVKTTQVGTYTICWRSASLDMNMVKEYTINTTNTWEKKTITWTFNNSGGTWDYTNGIGGWLCWNFAHGSNFHTTKDAWQSTSAVMSTSAVANSGLGLNGDTNNTFFLSQVQLELGSSATPFEHRSYGDELLRCQRYYLNSYRQNEEVIVGGSASYPSSQPGHDDGMYNTSWSDGNCSGPTFPVVMRTQPTITLKSFASNTAGKCTVSGTEQSCSATTYNHQWVSHLVVGGSHANGAYVHYAYEATAEL